MLAALAIFQPVRLDDPDFEAAVSELTGIGSWDVVNGRIRELEDAGLVLRRDSTSVRVIPDMFADVLVANAAFDDRSSLSTSFLPRAQRAASGAALHHLLVNASRIDWQVRDGGSGRTDIVDGLWAALRQQLLGASFDEQLGLLKLVSRIAYFQPDLALQLVDTVLTAEADDAHKLTLLSTAGLPHAPTSSMPPSQSSKTSPTILSSCARRLIDYGRSP